MMFSDLELSLQTELYCDRILVMGVALMLYYRPLPTLLVRQNALLAFFLLLIAAPTRAQVDSATIVGTVRDSTGGAIASCSITVTNEGTNVSRKTVTTELGEYTVTQLKPGLYSVSAEQPGFQTLSQRSIKLDINQVARVDFTLKPGQVNEQIQVIAAEPLIESQTSSLGQVIEENRVEELPLNGRNFVQLAYLSPGVNQGPAGIVQQGGIPENERGNGAIQANGLMATNNNFLLNGFDNNEQQIGFEVIQPPVDAIQEFKVQTNNFGADIGRGGAVVNVVLKSGTNQFHGSLFEFFRNSALDAKNYFDNPALPIPPFRQNQFGGTLGGPILKSKTFFFMDYQGTRIEQSQTVISTVPTLLERTGDFSELLGTDNQGNVTGQIIDPASGKPFPGNKIPACPVPAGNSCLDPAGSNMLNLFPKPNLGTGMVNNYLSNPVVKNNQDSFDVRIDQQFGDHDSLFGSVSYGNVNALFPDPFPGDAGGGSFSGNIQNFSLAVGLSETHTFAQNKINEFKIGYMRYAVNAEPFFLGQPIAQENGIPGINIPGNPATGGLPNITVSGLSPLGNQDWFPEQLYENNYQLLDSFSYIRGQHTIKFGGDLRRREHSFYQVQNPRGDMYFTGQFTGNAVADLAIGYVQNAFRDGQLGNYGMGWWEISAYAMDDYRVTPKLTLNLGLRYDIYTAMVEQHNKLANFNFATGQFVAPGMPGVSRSGNVSTNYLDLAPRVGFAYSLGNDNKTVVRGAYGIFYDLQADQNDAELFYNPEGWYGSQSLLVPVTSTTPAMVLSSGFPTPLPYPSLSNPSGRASAKFFYTPTTYIEEWNLNVQRQLLRDMMLQVAYVGTHGVHLAYLRNLNQAPQPEDSNFEVCPPVPNDPYCPAGLPSNYGRPYYFTVPSIAAIRTEGHDISSSTNGLQVSLEKRFSAGWTLLTAYTYQHTLGQSAENETVGTSLEPQDTYNMKAERGDVEPDYRNQFTAAASYELPFGPHQKYFTGSGSSRWVAAGWQLNAIIALYSGRAFTPYLSYDPTNTSSGGPRPDIVGNPRDYSHLTTLGFNGTVYNASNPSPCPLNQQTIQCWFNPAAFSLPPPAVVNGVTQTATQFGDAGRGILRGPAQYNVDFSVFKDFALTESKTLQFRAEFFNLLNTPQFGDPGYDVDLPSAGSITSTVHSSRQIQFALRFIF